MPDLPKLVASGERPLRIAHLTTVDMSLELLLGTELTVDVELGLQTFGISAPGPYVPGVERRGVRHVALPALTRAWSPVRDAYATAQLIAVLRRLRLDVLHTHTPKAGVIGRVVGRLLGVPVVVNTCHGLWTRPDQRAPARAAVVLVEGVASLFSHAELYQNAEDARTLRRWSGGRQRVVGNGVDLTRFVPDPAARRRVRRDLGVPDERVLVGGVGRVVAEKGVEEFAACAGALAEEATFVWAGPIDPAGGAQPAPFPAAVRYLGERTDMPALYSALDVFVLPSYREGFSRAAMEAAAVGTAIVLTDIRGCREVGTHGEHLLLVPPHDADALTVAVRDLVADAARREALAAAARTRALEAFDQVAVAAHSLHAYAEVAARRGLAWTVQGSRVP